MLYRFSAQFPDTVRYNLTAQLRRAATSVPLNIAEGSGCQRLYPVLAIQSLSALIDEGNQISRMTHSLMQRLGPPQNC